MILEKLKKKKKFIGKQIEKSLREFKVRDTVEDYLQTPTTYCLSGSH